MTQYVTAQPGFYVLYPEDKNAASVEDISKIPIVAWKVVETGDGNSDQFCIPVCIESISNFESLYILTPDGQVYEPEFASWASLEGWLIAKQRK
jgi:hypothetical protein